MKTLVFIFTILFSTTVFSNNKKPTLVLDLDGVFLHNPYNLQDTKQEPIDELHNKFPADQIRYCFKLQDKVYDMRQLLPAYTKQFLAFAKKNFNIGFFSSAAEERNIKAVDAIWRFAFGEGVPETVLIKSQKDLVDDEIERYGKKDIKGFHSENQISNVILLDDNPRFMLYGQENNFLLCPNKADGFLFYLNYKDQELDFLKKSVEEPLLFYKLVFIAGILKEALDRSVKEKTSITEQLSELQIAGCQMNRYYYDKGLRMVEKFNSKNDFGNYLPLISYLPLTEASFIEGVQFSQNLLGCFLSKAS